MTANVVKLRGTAKKLVDRFAEASQSWGWEKDQGIGSTVATAEQERDAAHTALVRYIARLQKRAAHATRGGA